MAPKRKRQSLEASSAAAGILEGCSPTAAARNLSTALAAVDLAPVLLQIGDSAQSRLKLRELQRFLVLKAVTRDGEDGSPLALSPSSFVDSAWHALMLRPGLYWAASKALGFETPKEHDPLGGRDAAARAERLQRTRDLYKGNLGVVLPPEAWDEAGPVELDGNGGNGGASPTALPASGVAAAGQDQPAAAATGAPGPAAAAADRVSPRRAAAAAPATSPSAGAAASAAPIAARHQQPVVAAPALPPPHQGQQQPVGEPTMTVFIADDSGDRVAFKVHETTLARRVVRAYCEMREIDIWTVRFLSPHTARSRFWRRRPQLRRLRDRERRRDYLHA